MHRRSAALIPPALLLAMLVPVEAARAHRLEAEALVLPFGQVQVETWFETGDSPRSARVAVFRANGTLLIDGRATDKGIFVFTYQDIEPLRIVVNGGGGHRTECRVTTEALTRTTACTVTAALTPTPAPFLTAALLAPLPTTAPPAPQPLVRRETGPDYKNLVLGVGILLGIAMLATQWRRMKGMRGTVEKTGA